MRLWTIELLSLQIWQAATAAPGIAWDTLPRIDLVLVSHDHYDHVDLATLQRLWRRDRPLIVTPLGNDAILRSHGIGAVAADWGGVVTVRGRTPVVRDG